jgi:hypothetical protein
MNYIVDRRLNAKNKSAVNRQRFLRRYKEHIRKAVSDAVTQRSITDIENGEKIRIPSRDVGEPVFHHDRGGQMENVLPGNREFIAGDRIERPPAGGAGGSGSGASDQGEGTDDFVFQISQEEFLNFMFEDLELPNLVKRQLVGNEEFRRHRAGISEEGNPGQINIVRSLRAAHARRLALSGGKRRLLRELQQALADEMTKHEVLRDKLRIASLEEEIATLQSRIKRIPWLDTFDLKYNLHVTHPVPRSKAVMFCLMDVSGSMTQATKDIAKRFFILLYLFLQRNYTHTEVIFIRHHTSAKEVDEQEFFYSRETGGTIVSSALRLMQSIMEARFPTSEWNIYGAQASDGDNWNEDSSICQQLLAESILPRVQHFSYVEITQREHQALWYEYEEVRQRFPHAFAMQQITDVRDIYPVFRELFHKAPHRQAG